MNTSHEFEPKGMFAPEDSIEILGARENAQHTFDEVDVVLADPKGHKWYMTIITPDRVIHQTLEDLDDPASVAESVSTAPEPLRMVWNGDLTEDSVHKILTQTSLDLLAPYLVSLDEEV
jgi:hypothetical protein